MAQVIKAVAQPVFIKKKHELADMLKKLEDVSPAAIDIIVDTMNNTDTDPKLKVSCATSLLDFQIKVSAEISRDQLVRQIAEIKKSGVVTPLELEPGEKRRLPPTTDFNTVQSV